MNRWFYSQNKRSCKYGHFKQVNSNSNVTCQVKLSDTMNPRWLREMDGKTVEEDRQLYPNIAKFNSSYYHRSVKKDSLSIFPTHTDHP